MHAFMHHRGHAGAARASPASPEQRSTPARRPRIGATAPPPLRSRLLLGSIAASAAASSDAQSPSPAPSSAERQAFEDADAVRQRLLAVRRPAPRSAPPPPPTPPTPTAPSPSRPRPRRPDLHGPAGDLASRLAGSGPGGLASVGSGLLAPTLQQQTRIEEATEAFAAAASEGGKAAAAGAQRQQQQPGSAAAFASSSAPPPWESPDERAARERVDAARGDFGLPPGADVAEVEADESARDPRALLEALALLAGARHHSPPNRRMLLPLLRYAGPRLLLSSSPSSSPSSSEDAAAAATATAADPVASALSRPPDPLSSRELVGLAHAMARIGPAAAPTRRFLAQLLLALRARGFWAADDRADDGKDDEGERASCGNGNGGQDEDGDGELALARLSWALPQLAAWADDEAGGGAQQGAAAGAPSPDERALWHLLIGRTLADEEGLPWLEREQMRRRREEEEGGGRGGGGKSNSSSSNPLPEGCVVSAHLAACARLVRQRGRGGTPARDLANMLAMPVSLAQQLEVAAAEAAAAAEGGSGGGGGGGNNPADDAASSAAAAAAPGATAFYSAAADAVRAAALPLAQAAVDGLEPAPSSSSGLAPLALAVPFEAAALLGALAALGARPRAGWVRAAAAAALDADFMLPLYELGELADVSRALLAFATRLAAEEEEEGDAGGGGGGGGGDDAATTTIPAAERRAWGRALRGSIVAAGAAAAARAAEAGDRRADLAASRVQRAAREAAEALEAMG